ncbi:lysophosphatidic acid receptor 4-like [Dendronephthya gigantea]|uniref:lysophosphatidic acid receptor 4-like n=1 Tax=Dendronephthya gigantea TaxID=151771 RepID=UPI00106C510B|nr:lysophosphatidic acid receptor 4-like [Dendronephthya gigantea]
MMMDQFNHSLFNSSFYPTDFGKVTANVYIICEITLASLALLFNSTLLFVLYKDPLKRFRDSFNIFLTSLTFANTLTVTSLLLSKVLPLVTYPLPAVAEAVLGSALVSGTQSSFLVVTCITLDRLVGVAFPFRHKSLVTKRRACFANLAIWCVSISLDPILYRQVMFRVAWFQLYAAEILCLCLISLIVYPITLMKFLRGEARRTKVMSPSKSWRAERLTRKRHLTCTVLLITVTMVIFTVPYIILSVFVWIDCIGCLLAPAFLELLVLYPIVYAGHFGLNPFIYAWRLPDYRRSLVSLACMRQIRSNQI